MMAQVGPRAHAQSSTSLAQHDFDVAISMDLTPACPPMNWSSAMFMKTEATDGKKATEARRDCHEVSAG